MEEQEGIEWALRSVEFAFDCGVECCAIIPTRGGNGAMEELASQNWFAPPELTSLETVFDEALAFQRGRVFVDLWDLEKLSRCPRCFAQRRQRLQSMNLHQQVLAPIECECLS